MLEGVRDSNIFVSIASYCDSQLEPTIQDLLRKADNPERLRFGICWQHSQRETLSALTQDSRFCILDVSAADSKGACWARSEAMKLWAGEAWFLQVDSHCRFARSWDSKLIHMMAQTGSDKPILSTYANSFRVSEGNGALSEQLVGTPQQIAFAKFEADGIPSFKPAPLPERQDTNRPVRARFLAGGFLFAQGMFVLEVPYDPHLYFLGEEISMSLRAFTQGYDLFHPTECVVWHDYIRSYAIRHWEEHGSEREATSWKSLEARSRERLKLLLSGDVRRWHGAFGLGECRSREQYEAYAGLSFAKHKIQDYTTLALEPPNPLLESDWTDRIHTWLVRMTLITRVIPLTLLADAESWVVRIHDEQTREMHRHDFTSADLSRLTGDEDRIVLVVELQSGRVPYYWTLLPFNSTTGWGQMLRRKLADDDFTIVDD